MTTIGVLGASWRATVTPWGDVEPWDGSAPLGWFVAADDRWHLPAREASVRQTRVEGTPVVETRLRVPSGDVVHRVYAVADAGGLTIIEVENDSPLPVAVAFSRGDLLTARPPAAIPVEGIELPEGSVVLPVGHRSSTMVALAHDARGPGALPPDTAPLRAVVRGWCSTAERASRLVLADQGLVDAVVAARCEVALGVVPDANDDPVGFVLGLCEAIRMGEPADPWLPELAGQVETLARSGSGSGAPWDLDRAVVAFGEVLAQVEDRRALSDLADLRRRLGARATSTAAMPDGVRCIAWTEDLLLRPEIDGSCTLLPRGLPAPWFGANLEVYRLPAGDGHHVSYALRWHGERPALLWEVSGDTGLVVRGGGLDPDWLSTDAQGEALLRVPPGAPASPPGSERTADPGSFS